MKIRTTLALLLLPAVMMATDGYHVSRASDFLLALGSDRTVYVDADFALNDAIAEAQSGLPRLSDDELPSAPGVYLQETHDGYELLLYGLKNLSITSGLDGGALITAKPRYANVIRMRKCQNISLKNLTLGHEPEQGSCIGGVVKLEMCRNISLDHCDLYGCGIMGIEAENSSDLTCNKTIIRDCTERMMSLSGCNGARFTECLFHSCPDGLGLSQNNLGIVFDRCAIGQIEGDGSVVDMGDSEVSFIRSQYLEVGEGATGSIVPGLDIADELAFNIADDAGPEFRDSEKIPDGTLWYMGGDAYQANVNGQDLSFTSWNLHEGGGWMELKYNSPGGNYFIENTSGGNAVAEPIIVEGGPVIVFYNAQNEASEVMIPLNTGLEKTLKNDLYIVLEGCYADKQGRPAYIGNDSIQLPGGTLRPLVFESEYDTPTNVITYEKKHYRFTITRDGLTLTPVAPAPRDASTFTPVKGAKPLTLYYKSNLSEGFAGRWAWTAYTFVQRQQLEWFSKEALRYMRNELYARHGYLFSGGELKTYFESQPWYEPNPDGDNNRVHLSQTEMLNAEVIRAYEQER